MKISQLARLLPIVLLGCGAPDSSPSSAEITAGATAGPAEAPEKVFAATGRDVPDPCALLRPEELEPLGGVVQAGKEEEVGWENIRKCTWEADAPGYYGVSLWMVEGGFARVREMKMLGGEEQEIAELGMPALFEIILDGVAGIAVEQGSLALLVYPVWTKRPSPDSEAAATLEQVARTAAERL